MAKKVSVGKKVTISAGKPVTVYDVFGPYTTYQERQSTVTVRETQKAGIKTRIFWKRNGYRASALV